MSMIISVNDFLYLGILYMRDSMTGRCYRLAEPSGIYSKAARKDLLIRKRISLANYTERRKECEQKLAGGAA
jgi:hypothetical protein